MYIGQKVLHRKDIKTLMHILKKKNKKNQGYKLLKSYLS